MNTTDLNHATINHSSTNDAEAIQPARDHPPAIREQLYQRVFPQSKTVQRWLTLLSGKPHAGQQLPQRTPWGVLRTSIAAFAGGIALSGWVVTSICVMTCARQASVAASSSPTSAAR